jgi:hypothetical protein
MGSPNVELAREYLRAVESMGPPENVARFCGDEIEFHEFPNRIAPLGRVRRRGDCEPVGAVAGAGAPVGERNG